MTQSEYEFKRDNLLAQLACTNPISQNFTKIAAELAKLYKEYNNAKK